MREIHPLFTDIDRYLEEALRAKQRLDAQRWRDELRPRAMRLFAARATKLTWSRALLKLVVQELYPDDLFKELISDLDRVPRREWPGVIAVVVALRHSWRRDDLARIARRLHVPLTTSERAHASNTKQPSRPSRKRFSGSPRTRQGSPLRSDPAQRGSRP
jgi:hypothetical protein